MLMARGSGAKQRCGRGRGAVRGSESSAASSRSNSAGVLPGLTMHTRKSRSANSGSSPWRRRASAACSPVRPMAAACIESLSASPGITETPAAERRAFRAAKSRASACRAAGSGPERARFTRSSDSKIR